MSYEVALAGALIASWCALGGAVRVAVRRGGRLQAQAQWPQPGHVGPDAGNSAGNAELDATQRPGDLDAAPLGAAPLVVADDGIGDLGFARLRFDDDSRSALTACLFAVTPAEHMWWTVLVIDPALHETPSHMRLVGHYQTEIVAMSAAGELADALNTCLVPGEAPLTTSALGIEAEAEPEPAMGTEAEAEPARSVAARAGAGAGPGGPAEFTQPTRRSHRPAPRGNVAIT